MRAGVRKKRQSGTGEADRERRITMEWRRAFEAGVEGAIKRSERWREREKEELLLGCHLQSKISYDISNEVVMEVEHSFI